MGKKHPDRLLRYLLEWELHRYQGMMLLRVTVRSVAIRHLYKRQVRTGAFREYEEIVIILGETQLFM